MNLWIDSNDSYSEDIEVTTTRLDNLNIIYHDFRDSDIFKTSLLSKYLDEDKSEDPISENIFDHLIQCGMNWETIDLLKIATVLHDLSCGVEMSIFSDLDITPFSIGDRLSETNYGHNIMNLLET